MSNTWEKSFIDPFTIPQYKNINYCKSTHYIRNNNIKPLYSQSGKHNSRDTNDLINDNLKYCESHLFKSYNSIVSKQPLEQQNTDIQTTRNIKHTDINTVTNQSTSCNNKINTCTNRLNCNMAPNNNRNLNTNTVNTVENTSTTAVNPMKNVNTNEAASSIIPNASEAAVSTIINTSSNAAVAIVNTMMNASEAPVSTTSVNCVISEQDRIDEDIVSNLDDKMLVDLECDKVEINLSNMSNVLEEMENYLVRSEKILSCVSKSRLALNGIIKKSDIKKYNIRYSKMDNSNMFSAASLQEQLMNNMADAVVQKQNNFKELTWENLNTSFTVVINMNMNTKLMIVNDSYLAEDNSLLQSFTRSCTREQIYEFLEHMYLSTTKYVDLIILELVDGLNVDTNTSKMSLLVYKLCVFEYSFDKIMVVYKKDSGIYAKMQTLKNNFMQFRENLMRRLIIGFTNEVDNLD